MNDFCHFLDDDTLMEGQCCVPGVNFVNVGPNRSLCQVCPLSKLVDLPFCPNVEVYTNFRNSPDGPFIDVGFACLVVYVHPDERCQNCPDHLHSPSVDQEHGLRIPIRDET